MKFRKLLVLTSGLLFVTGALAGKEDWNGTFKIQVSDSIVWNVEHSKNYTKLLFISAGKCISLKKGSRLNGVSIKEDVNLCVNTNAPDFVNEVEKLGTIVSKQIELGSTYTEAN